MTALWNAFLHVLNTMPAWLAAILVGWAFSVGLTHGVKFSIPVRVCADLRELVTRVTAFLSAAIFAGLYYASRPDAEPIGAFLVMAGAGIWSPLAFAMLQWALRLHPKTSTLADILSADTRGVLKAKLGAKP